MQITHADEIEWKRGLEYRGGTFHARTLLTGRPGTLGNFQLNLGRVQGDFSSPRHRHNFDQFRFQVEGVADFARDGKMTPGCLGYFPEGAAYGPQSNADTAITLVLQFGAASGSGYLSAGEVDAGRKALQNEGEFKGGVFTRREGVPGRKNTDGYQAIWENQRGRDMEYPKPRYRTPIMLDIDHFDWRPAMRGVDEKVLGIFTERRAEARLYRIEADSSFTLPTRSIYFVLSGEGTIESAPYRKWTACHLDEGEIATLTARTETIVLRLGLPDLRDLEVTAPRLAAE